MNLASLSPTHQTFASEVEEKASEAGGMKNHSTLDAPDVKNAGDTDSKPSEQSPQETSKDEYPHGLQLVLLAGASLVAVFLIALDQVRISAHTQYFQGNRTSSDPRTPF